MRTAPRLCGRSATVCRSRQARVASAAALRRLRLGAQTLVLTEDIIARHLAPHQVENVFHVSPDRRLLYVANQKAACSTVKFVLHRLYSPHASSDLEMVHDKSASPLLSPNDIGMGRFLDELNGGAYFIFTVVRDPYARLLSGFRNKIARPSLQRQRVVAKIARNDPTLRDFVDFLASSKPPAMNPHWRPQWINTFVKHIRYDLIGRTENLAADLSAVTGRLGLPTPAVPQLNETLPLESEAGSLAAELDRINVIYKWDFSRFDYPMRRTPADLQRKLI